MPIREIATILTAKDRASDDINRVSRAGDEAAESISQTEEQLDRASQAFAATGVATAALGGSIAALTARFSRLGQTFQTIQTTSGATAEEMDAIKAATKDISTSLPVTLRQSTEAAKQLSFAGLSASETMAALSETSQLAVASNLQAGQAAQTVARSLNAFELEARQTDAVVGSLGQTFASSATNIRSLAQGLTEVQATANAAGLSVAETTASLGLLASSGLAGSKAGTSLNAVLRRLTSGSGETKEALDRLGLSMQDFTDSSGSLRGVSSIMSTLSERMNEAGSEAERIQIAQQLAGSEGARALLPLIRNTDELSQKINNNLRAEIQGAVGDLAEMDGSQLEATSQALGTEVGAQTSTTELISSLQALEAQGESTDEIASRLQVGLGLTGDAANLLATDITETDKSAEELAEGIGGVVTAEELAEKQTETVRGQITQLRSDLEVLGNEMFQGTKPAVTAVVGALRNVTTPLAENRGAAKALGGGLVALTAAGGVATAMLGAHVAQLKIATIAQQGHASSTLAGTAALKAHAVATAAASKAQWLMTASSGQLAAAIVGKTGALAGEIAALKVSTIAALSNATAMGILSGAAGLATTAITALWAATGPIGLAVLGLTAGIIGLAGVMKTDLFGAGDKAAAIFGVLGDAADTTVGIIGQLLGIGAELGRIGLTAGALGLIAPFAAVLKLPGMIQGVAPRVKSAAMSLPSKITEGLAALGPAKYALPLLGPLLLAKDVITDPGEWIAAGKQIPSMIASGIKSTATDPVGAVTSMVGDVRDRLPFSPAAAGPLTDLGETGPGLVSTIATGIEDEAPQLTSVVESMFAATPLGMAFNAGQSLAGGQQPPQPAQGSQSSGDGISVDITIEEINAGDGSTDAVRQAAESGLQDPVDKLIRQLSREIPQ